MIDKQYRYWLTSSSFDEATKAELRDIIDCREEIEDRFYKELDFGTGGLRGVIGAGTNRMNVYTVQKATQGLANYIKKRDGQDKGVAIAYDSRRYSADFALAAALCLNGNGIKTYLFDSLRPTPELSFALRVLGCIAGIVITASHNPAEYNGYKVYWEDGAQITAPTDKEIIAEVSSVRSYEAICTMEKADAIVRGLFHTIGEEMDANYMEALQRLVLRPDSIARMAPVMKIVYSPLHGTGNIPVRRILKELGFLCVYVVTAQEQPDGNFPTVESPNPEDPKVFKLALELAVEVEADIILATDPDADRLGVYAKDDKTGTYRQFTGNMTGLLICEYQLETKKALGILPENGAVVGTVVSSNLAGPICREYGVTYIETLTGFKYIGEQIRLFEEDNSYEYLFGFEESYGCLLGTHARDKDAVSAVMALCEAAAYYQEKGMTLCDQMERIYQKYGFYKEELVTKTLTGASGKQQMKAIMDIYRTAPEHAAGGYQLLSVSDYEKGIKYHISSGESQELHFPKSDVLYFELAQDAWFCVRPSGTEPKIKFYFGVRGTDAGDADRQLLLLKEAVLKDSFAGF